MKLNKIYNEDCIETMKRMPEGFVDLTVTSPPYFNAREYSQYGSIEEYRASMSQVFEELLRVTKPAHYFALNVSPVLIPRAKRSASSQRVPIPFHLTCDAENVGWRFIDDIIWIKPAGAAKNRVGGFEQHRKPRGYKPNIVTEYILIFQKPAPYLVDKTMKPHSLVETFERTNVWSINPETKSQHPAPYPVGLAERTIRYYSYEQEVVYDPFMGSGTTAKACQGLNRNYIGSEISKEYCDIAEKRLAQEVLL